MKSKAKFLETGILRIQCIFVLALGPSGVASSQTVELRAAWYTPRISAGLATQAQIAAAMDSLANNNFNTVMFNVWTQGYPLWQSRVFGEATGGVARTDPRAGTRDLLHEAIGEAHRRGLAIEAWFEYGFIGGYSGNRPGGSRHGVLLDRYPSWLGKSSGGSDSVLIGGTTQAHYWMSHAHPGVQRFLKDLVAEIAANYDVDAIELDRIRYPSNDRGYDSTTTALYRAHSGSNPPTNSSDPLWKRWRADNLNSFHKMVYDTLKRLNPFVDVTNAPSHYAGGSSYPAYEAFNQDWVAWLNGGYVDALHLQQYATLANFSSYVDSWMQFRVTDPVMQKRVFPSIAIRGDSHQLTSADLLAEINLSRSRGLLGNPIWYYEYLNGLENGRTYWSYLKAGPFSAPASSPLHAAGWRRPGILLSERDTSVATVLGSWSSGTPPGYFGPLMLGNAGAAKSVSYFAVVPESGWYDVYAYLVGQPLLSARTPFDLFDSSGSKVRVLIDQSNPALSGWTRIGSVNLTVGKRHNVALLSNESIEPDRSVMAGGLMLLMNRLSTSTKTPTSVSLLNRIRIGGVEVSEVYPNPSNPTMQVQFMVRSRTGVTSQLFDLLGRKVLTLQENELLEPGTHEVRVNLSGLSSGTYVLRISSTEGVATRKLVLVR